MQVLILVALLAVAVDRFGLLDTSVDTSVRTIGEGELPSAAVTLAREGWPGGAETIIVASLSTPEDALAAGGLAGALDAPILLNEADRMSPALREALREHEPRQALILGPVASLSGIVTRTLEEEYDITVERLDGSTPAAIAAAIAGRFLREREPGLLDGKRTAVLVDGGQTIEAVAASGLVAARDAPLPVLVVTEGRIPPETRAVLRDADVEQVLLVGSAAQGVTSEALALGLDVVSLTGPTPQAVAVEVAEHVQRAKGFVPPLVVIAAPDDPVRGLLAAPIAGARSGTVLLSGQPLGVEAQQWLAAECGHVPRILIVGEAEPSLIRDVSATASC